MTFNLQDLLNKDPEDPSFQSFLSQAGYSGTALRSSVMDKADFESRYEFLNEIGVAIGFKFEAEKRVAKSVVVELADYSGESPFGLTSNATREDVEAQFGTPHFVSPHGDNDGVGLVYYSESHILWINVVGGHIRDVNASLPDESEKHIYKRINNPTEYGTPPVPSAAANVRELSFESIAQEWRHRSTLRKFAQNKSSNKLVSFWRRSNGKPPLPQTSFVDQINIAVAHFIQEVVQAAEAEDMKALLKAARNLVIHVNEINAESCTVHDEPMIETLERDELGVFIDSVVKSSGAGIEDGDDISLPWREW